MAQDDGVFYALWVQGGGVVVGGISDFWHHAHVNEAEEPANCVNVYLLFVTGHGLCMEMQFQIRVEHDPVDFVTVSADRLLYSLPIPITWQLSLPTLVIGFQFVHLP